MTSRLLPPAAALLALLALTACGPAAPVETPAPPVVEAPSPALPPVEAPAAPAIVVALDSEGLRLVTHDGKTRLIAFGQPKASALEILTRAQGAAPSQSRNDECGAGPIDFAQWPGGLNMLFQDDAFVGWSVNDDPAGKLTTLNGVGLGATRATLRSGYADVQLQESTLGEEFTAGGMSGILDGDGPGARIEALWAGTSCVFR